MKRISWLVLGVLLLGAAGARAANSSADPNTKGLSGDDSVKALSTQPALQEIVYGLSMQMRIGMGLMALGTKIPADSDFPQLTNQPEALGFGAVIDFVLGYDISEVLALNLVGGLNVTAGRRPDRVRALSLAYGGAGVRLALPMWERMNLVVAPAVIYADSDTVVEPATRGLGILASVGIEYFVHVRHFAVGVDLTGLLPLAPTRLFIGLAPHLRYTF